MELAASARLAFTVHEDFFVVEQVACLATRIDQVGELQQLPETDHLSPNGDLARCRHLWECGGHMSLPQLSGGLFVTDAGMETDLIFNRGVDLPEFAAFVVLDDAHGFGALMDYYEDFFDIAREHSAGLILDTPTWRANRDWGERLGYDRARLAETNRRWVETLAELQAKWSADVAPIVLDGLIGPRGDGYVPGEQMSTGEAAQYHSDQIAALADAGVDMVTVLTMNYAAEAAGVALAAAEHGVPAAIAFTVETDGRLPTGQSLAEAIDQVDAETGGTPAYFMVNCAHPTHFEHVLDEPGPWRERIRGIRANASTMSHAELDEAEELDPGNPAELADGYTRLRVQLPNLCVVGGCCGTDQRHVAAVMERFA